MSLWSKFLDLLFPPRCAFCGGLLDGEAGGVCAGCEKALPYVEEGQSLRALDFGPCAAAFYYEGMVRQGIHGLKFQGRRQSAAVFARYMAETAAEHFSGQFDAVTFVPVSEKRLKQRGYDRRRCWRKSGTTRPSRALPAPRRGGRTCGTPTGSGPARM